MNIEVREYIDARGHNHYREWSSKLDPSVRARIDKSVFRVGYGNLSGVKLEGEGVSALRVDFGSGYRGYLGQDGDQLVILLAGGTKRRQENDIQLARSQWSEYKKRKRENKREK
jgi:putative addiction module killer protein